LFKSIAYIYGIYLKTREPIYGSIFLCQDNVALQKN